MSTEWWNLDQALLWAATRNTELVEAAAGHPSNPRERDGGWLLYWHSISEQEILETESGEHPHLGALQSNAATSKIELGMHDWHQETLKRLADGTMPAIQCAGNFPQVHPAWFLGAHIECPLMDENDPDRVSIAKTVKYIDGALPPLGLKEVICIVVDSSAARAAFPEAGEITHGTSARPQRSPKPLGGRPTKYNTVLLVSIAAKLIHEGLQPESQAELRKQSLEEYSRQNGRGAIPSDEWAKPPIRCLWNQLNLDRRYL